MEFNLFGRKYIIGKKEEPSKVKRTVEKMITSPKGYKVNELDLVMLRKIALREPIFLGGVYKKNRDTVRNWFKIKTVDGQNSISKTDFKIISNFDIRTDFKNKLFKAGVCANIYGTGFLEKTFMEPKNKTAESPVSKNAEPLGVNILNSERILERKKKEKGNIRYYIYGDKPDNEVYIHPDRIIPVIIDGLPFNEFGISKVNVLANILKSKMNADVASGEIMSWHSHGILDMTILDMDDEQEKHMIKKFLEHPSAYVHDQDYTLEVKNPTQIDPEPFYNYFYTNIARALEMPSHILTGVHEGSVQASEAQLSDYYHDIENIQQTVFTPIIEELYQQLLESKGKRWKYKLVWNPIFIDEMSEARILQARTFSATQNADRGIISVPEARKILNQGVIVLNPDEIPEPPKPVVKPADPNVDPNVEPQPPVKKPTIKNWVPGLTEEQKLMIREAGIREMMAQEERLIEAKKKKKGR